MPRYLTDEWLAAADRALNANASLASAARDVRIVVQQIVTGGADGDVAFHVDLDHGAVGVAPGNASEPTVTFMQDWNTAAAVARGEESAQGAFMHGQIQVRGDLAVLIDNAALFAGIDDALSDLRADTTY